MKSLLLAALIAPTTACRAQIPKDPLFALDSAMALATRLALDNHLPGLVVAITGPDSMLWCHAEGWADVDQRVPMSCSTQIRIGSVSKLLTAEATDRLCQADQLRLDSPIVELLPELPHQYAHLTPRMLLGHLGGVRHYRRGEYINHTAYSGVREALIKFISDSLVAAPGAQYSYSSYGYVLLSAVIERAAGMPFLDYMQDSLFNHIGMTSTTADKLDTREMHEAVPYNLDSLHHPVMAAPIDLSDRWGAGGYLSNAMDLAAFCRYQMKKGLLGDGVPGMFTPQMTSNGTQTKTGWGWRLASDTDTIYYHGGDSLGGRAMVLLLPQRELAVILLSNLSFAPLSEREALHFASFLH